MDSKRLRKSSRQELLEMFLEATEENERLRQENEALRQEIESRRLVCQNSGSLAEAALKLSGIFEAADEAIRICQANVQPLQTEPDTDAARGKEPQDGSPDKQ